MTPIYTLCRSFDDDIALVAVLTCIDTICFTIDGRNIGHALYLQWQIPQPLWLPAKFSPIRGEEIISRLNSNTPLILLLCHSNTCHGILKHRSRTGNSNESLKARGHVHGEQSTE